MKPEIHISVYLSNDEAAALAQFLKRVSFSDFRPLAYHDEEAYAMQAAAEHLRTALADVGYAPR